MTLWTLVVDRYKELLFRIRNNWWGKIHPYNPEDPWQKDMSDYTKTSK